MKCLTKFQSPLAKKHLQLDQQTLGETPAGLARVNS